MIRWKIDPLALLKENGYTTYRLRHEKLFSESTVHKFRHGVMVSPSELDTLCRLTKKQPGKLIEWVEDPEESKEPT